VLKFFSAESLNSVILDPMEPFKNLLGIQAARKISTAIAKAHPAFSARSFLKNLETELEPLELKQRVLLIKSRLERELPKDPKQSFEILRGSLESGLTGFHVWPLTQFVSDHGLAHFDLSMRALYDMTQVFTAEWAIRPFLVHDEDRTIRQLLKWTEDESEHTRRLTSEGSRPLLPWGQKLPSFIREPEKTWKILESLRHDDAKYVQKSVANHLNDHSKNHADWLVRKIKPWTKEDSDSVNWIVRHGTRTLVKKGHVGALTLHGVSVMDFGAVKIRARSKSVGLGGVLEIDIVLRNPTAKALNVLVDVEILFLKANGSHSPKVFKGKKFELAPHEMRKIEIRIPLKKVTTRVHYPGRHGFTVLLNGMRQKTQWFDSQINTD
jgi:3-methyladenine DNA glycosylase AlkC